MREASHDPNPRDGDAAASDGAGLAEPLLAEMDAEETEAFFSDYDRSDGGAAQTLPGASGTYEQTVGAQSDDDDIDDVRTRRRARFRGTGETRVASLMSRLAPVAFADVLATALISHAVLRLPLSAFLSLRHFQLVFAAAVATAAAKTSWKCLRLRNALRGSRNTAWLMSAVARTSANATGARRDIKEATRVSPVPRNRARRRVRTSSISSSSDCAPTVCSYVPEAPGSVCAAPPSDRS